MRTPRVEDEDEAPAPVTRPGARPEPQEVPMSSNDRAVALVRVSELGSRKEGVDLHSDVTQFKKIVRECDAAGWTLVRAEPFREMNVSGHRPLEHRPGLL